MADHIRLAFISVLFSTALVTIEGESGLSFLILGDWGGWTYYPYYTHIEKNVAKQMGHLAETILPNFVISVGDNFYVNGVLSVDDKRFKETFEKIFTHPSLQIPWYVIAGNHDHRGNVRAQIQYTQKSNIWHFPDYNYVRTLVLPDGVTEVTMIFIDTVLLCGITDKFYQGQGPISPEDPDVAEEIWGWLEARLKQSRSDYLLVIGHYPVLSVGYHGSTMCLVQRLRPLLFRYAVSAYLCGHDHNLQHFIDSDPVSLNQVHHIVSGAGALQNIQRPNGRTVPHASLQFFWPGDIEHVANEQSGGFAYAEMDSSGLNMTFVEGGGTSLHNVWIEPRRRENV